MTGMSDYNFRVINILNKTLVVTMLGCCLCVYNMTYTIKYKNVQNVSPTLNRQTRRLHYAKCIFSVVQYASAYQKAP